MPIDKPRRIGTRFATVCAAAALGVACLAGMNAPDTRTTLRMAFVEASYCRPAKSIGTGSTASKRTSPQSRRS